MQHLSFRLFLGDPPPIPTADVIHGSPLAQISYAPVEAIRTFPMLYIVIDLLISKSVDLDPASKKRG